MAMLPRSIITTGRQQAMATAMASPPRSRTPSSGWLNSQRPMPSASVMVARPISAARPATERPRVPASAARSSLESIAPLLAAAVLLDLGQHRLVDLGVARALRGPGLDDRLEGGVGGLLVGGARKHHLALRVVAQALHQLLVVHQHRVNIELVDPVVAVVADRLLRRRRQAVELRLVHHHGERDDAEAHEIMVGRDAVEAE